MASDITVRTPTRLCSRPSRAELLRRLNRSRGCPGQGSDESTSQARDTGVEFVQGRLPFIALIYLKSCSALSLFVPFDFVVIRGGGAQVGHKTPPLQALRPQRRHTELSVVVELCRVGDTVGRGRRELGRWLECRVVDLAQRSERRVCDFA